TATSSPTSSGCPGCRRPPSRRSSPRGCCSTSSPRWVSPPGRRSRGPSGCSCSLFLAEVSDESQNALDVRDLVRRRLHGHARQPRRHDGAAGHPPRPARRARQPRVDGQRLHALLRRPAADRRRARRPFRAPARVLVRPRRLHARLGGGGARAVDRRARRRARAVQGLGGAIVLPLTLTILSSAVPADKRGLALGAWGGISGLAVAFGPLVGGAVVSGMSFGMFGSVFLPAQFFQTVQHYTPLGSGLRILPWTAMPMLVAPVAGALSDRIGGHRLIGAGLALQAAGLAWIAALQTPTVAYADLIAPFTLSGIGMGLFFAPVANVVLSAVRPD